MTSQPPHTVGLEGSCYHHQRKFYVILKLNLHIFENVAKKGRTRIKEEFWTYESLSSYKYVDSL